MIAHGFIPILYDISRRKLPIFTRSVITITCILDASCGSIYTLLRLRLEETPASMEFVLAYKSVANITICWRTLKDLPIKGEIHLFLNITILCIIYVCDSKYRQISRRKLG